MKLAKLSWLLVLALCLSFTSCNNDDDDNDGGSTNVVKLPTKITAYEYDEDVAETETLELAYDSENRISQMEESDENSTRIIKFVYNANGQLTEINHYYKSAPTVLAYKEAYTYGSNKVTFSYGSTYGEGLNMKDYQNVYINTGNSTVKVADYDDAETNLSYRESIYAFDSKGNIIKRQVYSKNGTTTLTKKYDYAYSLDDKKGAFSNVKLSMPWVLTSEWSIYWGTNCFLVNNLSSVQLNGASQSAMTYEYDADGYPTKITIDGQVYYKFEYTTVK